MARYKSFKAKKSAPKDDKIDVYDVDSLKRAKKRLEAKLEYIESLIDAAKKKKGKED